MSRTRNPYPTEFRDQIVALARSGRNVEDLAREFEPCSATIHGWIKQANRDGGRQSDGLTSEERDELRRAWRDQSPSARSIVDATLTDRIKTIHTASRATYGAPRIHAELIDEGNQVSRKRVERLMKAAGLAGVSRRKGTRTTFRDERVRPACDLVDRNFYTDAPDQLWVADITYVPTWAGFLYLAVVPDAFSRRIVGWAMGHHLKTQLVLDAMNIAVALRKPQDVIHHSDQGSQYTSVAFGLRCKEAGVRPSMGSVGDAYDNAMCESFFATLECELLDRRKFKTKAEARMAVFQFIEGGTTPAGATQQFGGDARVAA